MQKRFEILYVALLVLIVRGLLLLINKHDNEKIVEAYNEYAEKILKIANKLRKKI